MGFNAGFAQPAVVVTERANHFVIQVEHDMGTAKDQDLLAMALEAGAMAGLPVVVDMSRLLCLNANVLDLLLNAGTERPWLAGPLFPLVHKRLVVSAPADAFRIFPSVEEATGETWY
ncbi:hypothetical protein OG897_35840 [Streptomyces sp. NBC_00237]|uniref:hypothetical protein n=1 Tax=Streptomyces sp. NBC_00237 TaxID=2975687 RepID=UPI0022558ED2|nr:hypothetical protein [Streptomyces sp. NBC_00237]MCX5206765.1 hypothetical protein [Streptomyces sp. NBC_00237]